MKKISKLMLSGVFVLVLSVLLGGNPVKAASVENLCDYTSKNTTVSADITGDNIKDTIQFKMTPDKECGYIQKLRVFVNGTKTLTVKEKDSYYHISATWIHMSKTKNLLQIIGRGDNDYCTFNSIYRYDSGTKKLVRVLDLTSNSLLADGQVMKATSKKIVIDHGFQPSETGWLRWKYSYVYKNNKLKRSSDTAAVKSSLGIGTQKDGYGKYFAKNQFIAARTIRFYTGTKMNKTAFSARKGDILTLKKVKISGSRMYLQYQSGRKTGWMEVNKNGYMENPFFYGVNERLAG